MPITNPFNKTPIKLTYKKRVLNLLQDAEGDAFIVSLARAYILKATDAQVEQIIPAIINLETAIQTGGDVRPALNTLGLDLGVLKFVADMFREDKG